MKKITLFVAFFCAVFTLKYTAHCSFEPDSISIEFKGHTYGMLESCIDVVSPDYYYKTFYNNVHNNYFSHLTGYNDTEIFTSLKDASIRLNIYNEHLSASGGTHNLENINTYFKYNFTYDKEFEIFDIPAGVYFSAGNFDDRDKYNRLLLYNLDNQGTQAKISFWKLAVGFRRIADLYYLGLNIGDLNEWYFLVKDVKITDDIVANYRAYQLIYLGNYNPSSLFYDEPQWSWGHWFGVNLFKKVDLYYQFGFRSIGGHFDDDPDIGIANLVGFEYNDEVKPEFINKLKWTGSFNYRQYGSVFNKYLNMPDHRENLLDHYPIDHYNTRFSKLAVYTEVPGQDVYGLEFYLDSEIYFSDDFHIYGNMDYNYIKFENEEGHLFPFSDFGFGYSFNENSYFRVGFTNKILDYSRGYPGFTEGENHYLWLNVKWDFGVDLLE